MSSQLTTFVPVMDGTNYQTWASKMQSYLMSQGQWKCVRGVSLLPGCVRDKDTKVVSIDNQELYDQWMELCEKCVGNIRLRLHHNIGHLHNATEKPQSLWNELKEKYGSPGVASAFSQFKQAMDTPIPNDADPSPALDKIMSHFVQLKEMKHDIPDNVVAMILL